MKLASDLRPCLLTMQPKRAPAEADAFNEEAPALQDAPGLLPWIKSHGDVMGVDPVTRCSLTFSSSYIVAGL